MEEEEEEVVMMMIVEGEVVTVMTPGDVIVILDQEGCLLEKIPDQRSVLSELSREPPSYPS